MEDGAVGKPFDEIKEGTIVGVFRDVRNQGFYQAQQPIVLKVVMRLIIPSMYG